jgi:hypothetical protein
MIQILHNITNSEFLVISAETACREYKENSHILLLFAALPSSLPVCLKMKPANTVSRQYKLANFQVFFLAMKGSYVKYLPTASGQKCIFKFETKNLVLHRCSSNKSVRLPFESLIVGK